MNLSEFLLHVPFWVWLLLIFLLRRGFAALYDREMKIGRLFLLPVLFLVWGGYGVMTETERAGVSLTMMVAGLLAGGALGYWMWGAQTPLQDSGNPGTVIRAGTPLTLCMIVITFFTKFILTSAIFLQPGLAASASFCLLMGGLTGLNDGVFWGGTLRIFIPWYNKHLTQL
ncbi:DUF6622 family protein [Enterobacter cancerogenus]|uniref:DUF6622 family protein n=1 Tax=Enterobacter cancerogenus TaxID=69218 RepID=UPI00384BFDE5